MVTPPLQENIFNLIQCKSLKILVNIFKTKKQFIEIGSITHSQLNSENIQGRHFAKSSKPPYVENSMKKNSEKHWCYLFLLNIINVSNFIMF